MANVDLAEFGELAIDRTMTAVTPFGMVAVDGERAFRFGPDDTVNVTLTADGPRAIDVEGVMELASARGLLARTALPP
jgi:hypothetical protein